MAFPDPEELMVDYLAAQLTDVTVSTDFPAGTGDHVQVEHEGGSMSWPITERAQMRFTCWVPPGQRSCAKELAGQVRDLVATHPGSTAVAGISNISARSAVVTDPDTKRLMCWFIATVSLLAQ